MKICVALLFVLCCPWSASAQTVIEQPVSYTVEIFAPGVPVTGSATSSAAVVATSVACNLPAVPRPATPPDNPVRIRFDDPLNAGMQCEVSFASQVLALVPLANYLATLTANGPTMSSGRSAASNPFNRKITVPPAVPKGLIALP